MDYYEYSRQFDLNAQNLTNVYPSNNQQPIYQPNYNQTMPPAVEGYPQNYVAPSNNDYYVQPSVVPTAYVEAPPNYYYNYPQANYSHQEPHYDLTLPKIDFDPKCDDELWIETWLSQVGKIRLNLDSTVTVNEEIEVKKPRIKPQKGLMIGVAKGYLKNWIALNEQLRMEHNFLKENASSLGTEEWRLKLNEIGALKYKLSLITKNFDRPEVIQSLRININKRKKKRTRNKKSKSDRKDELKIKLEKRQLLHREIDEWLDSMKDSVERGKMEENLKKDADCVLSEVTRKKAEARKQLSLIRALLKLRHTREHLALQQGQVTSSEDRTAFNKAADKLSAIWESSSAVYSKEEQGLRLMLEQTGDDNRQGTLAKERNIASKWENALYGSNWKEVNRYNWGLLAAETNFESFVAIRKSWDTFLTNASSEGSQVPIGVILPNPDANTAWTQYTRKFMLNK